MYGKLPDDSGFLGTSNIAAGMFGFQPAQPLEIAKPEAREAPKVSFT